MASAMSVIANGGVLMQPVLVRRVSEGRGDVIEETLPSARRRVIPRDTARLVEDMLTAVTGPNGTGTDAAIDGYLVAGKTGTAQKADYVTGGYADDRWIASFVGFVPAEDPRLVISVVIDEPVIVHYGGQVAGPVFRRVGEASLRHLGVPAATGGEALRAHATDRRRREREAEQSEREARLAGTEVPREPSPAITARMPIEGETSVPEVVGRTARAALVALHGAGLRVDLRGSGVVVRQVPSSGDVVPRGTAIRLELVPPSAAAAPDTADLPPNDPGELASVVRTGAPG
jgi:cell division protein FtsI (penicillin-binding protein 3)